jgi:hypothetical protein
VGDGTLAEDTENRGTSQGDPGYSAIIVELFHNGGADEGGRGCAELKK